MKAEPVNLNIEERCMSIRWFVLALLAALIMPGCTSPVKEQSASVSMINCNCQEGPHTFGPNDERTAAETCDVPDKACKNLCNAYGWGNGSLSYGGICVD